MLNLVQLQERLKDVPMQALMGYANGANPQIPPYLALGELNRRKQMQEAAAGEQAKQQAGAPTVKDQIEQQAGLLALQGSRMRQAGAQQQSAQANLPMAAPNTTTSEPAQMAAGGAVDDAMPRDFQRGGQAQLNPEMLKKLMMMRAMKQRQRQPRPGIAGLPVDTFKRQDYARGGIVGYAGTEGSLVDTSETMRKKADQYRALLQMLFGKKKEEVDPADQRAMLKAAPDEERVTAEESAYPDESRRGSGSFAMREPGFSRQFAVERPEEPAAPQNPAAPRAPSAGLSALQKYLALNPQTAIKDVERLKPAEFKAQREGLNALFGVPTDPYADLKQRYEKIEAEDARLREEQPMDRLTAILTGIAGSRRGAGFGEAGAAGAAAGAKLRQEQNVLNRKLAMDMATLRAAIAEKEDARARGDRDAFIAADEKAKAAQAKVESDRLELGKSQATAETQGRNVAAYERQASRPTASEEQRAAYARHVKETGERPTELGFQRFILGGRPSQTMTMEDAIRIATQQLGPGVSIDEVRQRASDLLRMGTGGGATQYTPMPTDKKQLVSGQVYSTPRGPARWDGKQFIPVQ